MLWHQQALCHQTSVHLRLLLVYLNGTYLTLDTCAFPRWVGYVHIVQRGGTASLWGFFVSLDLKPHLGLMLSIPRQHAVTSVLFELFSLPTCGFALDLFRVMTFDLVSDLCCWLKQLADSQSLVWSICREDVLGLPRCCVRTEKPSRQHCASLIVQDLQPNSCPIQQGSTSCQVTNSSPVCVGNLFSPPPHQHERNAVLGGICPSGNEAVASQEARPSRKLQYYFDTHTVAGDLPVHS